MSKEAMTLALEALELEDMACRYEKDPTPEHIAKAITHLQKALANEALDKMAENARQVGLDYEPVQQEPEAWMTQARCFVDVREVAEADAKLYGWKPLYTSPQPAQRTWVGLTDEEIDDATAYANPHCDEFDFARAIEAKLKEKNT